MDLAVKNNESIINKLNYDLLSNKIVNYNETDDYTNSIYIPDFKMNLFWEIARYKCPIIVFINESIKKNNLSERLEKQENILICPQSESIYFENKSNIKFNDMTTLDDFNIFLKSNKNLKNVILYNSKKETDIFNRFKYPIYSYFKSKNNILIPKLVLIENFITFMVKNYSKLYYIGNSINNKDLNKIEYYFTNTNKLSQGFLDISKEDLKKLEIKKKQSYLQLLRRKKTKQIILPKTEKTKDINKIVMINNIVDVLENPEKNKRILAKDYKKYLDKMSNIEYPDITNITKINFIIKDNSILDLNKGDQIELLEYQLMYNLMKNYMVYYNSVLLNDKIDDKNFIDMGKFMEEYNNLKQKNFLYKNKVVKCPKGKFSLIFYIGDTESDLEIYNSLPFPKILTSSIVSDIWGDDRHIVSFPSLNYKNVIASGILKDGNGTLISLPKRHIIKNNFLGPNLIVKPTLKTKYYADYLILLETNNSDSIEISLLENLLDKLRIKYNKNIVLFLSIDYKTNNNWIKTIEFSNYFKYIFEFDLVIVLEDIWKDNYSLTYTILNSINNTIPMLLAKSPIITENFVNYPGLFDGLNNNIIGINNLKLFFEKKLESLLSDDMDEYDYLKSKKSLWNGAVTKHYTSYFIEMINFLKIKNYKRDKINLLENKKNGYNFYYHENLNSVSLMNIYNNVDDFFDLVKDYKNILLISSDYPGYGGASSLNNEIAKVLRLKGHNCKELYYLFNNIKNADKIIEKYSYPNDYFDFEAMVDESEKFFYNDIRVCRFNNLLDDLNNMKFVPDLIILKNHLNGVILPDKFKNIYFLVAGIYQNSLNKFYYNLSLQESEKFINNNVLSLLGDSRIKGITNSLHTQDILEKHFGIKTLLYYINFIPYYPNKLPSINDNEFNKREYDYGIICSDFKRKIKNLENICSDLADNLNDNEKVILIGSNSSKYLGMFKNKKNITCINLVPNYLIPDYLKKIKYILLNSYYESNANLAIQAKFSGCSVIRKVMSKVLDKYSILITSTQKPGYGGSATNAYKLTKMLRDIGYNVGILFFNKENSDDINTDNIDGFFTLRDDLKSRDFYRESDKILVRNKIIEYFGGYPNVIYAFNYYTPILSRKLFPASYLYYFVVGNPVLSIGNESIIKKNISIQEFLKEDYKLESYNLETYNLEIESIEKSDEIVIDQGSLTIETISKVHPKYRYLFNEYYNYGIDILNSDIHQNLDERKEFELIAVSSNWERVVKNPRLVYMIFKKFPEYRKVIIGKNSNMFDKLPNTTCLNLLSYDEVQVYLAKSKVLLITSYSETGPNTMIEALNQKCQVLTSKNIGYQRYLSEYHLCEDIYNESEWCNKVIYLINNFNYLPIPLIDIQEDKLKFEKLILHKNISKKLNVLVVCGDKPYYGGAATNSYNLIKLLLEREYNVYGLFISYQKEGLDDPDNLGCVEHIFLDENIQRKLINWRESNIINYDIIFCKNYKVFTLIKQLLPYIPIIYSPSGLRQLTAIISKRKEFYNEMKDDIKLEGTKHEFIKDDNWYNFIMKNDRFLENYAFEKADYLLPNSKITYDVIKSYCNDNIKNKLLEPIYISNIQFIEKTNFNFRSRKYDFGFIATNWKRATKNIWLVRSLIKKLKGSSYNILVIGNNHGITEDKFPKDEYPNITIKNHVLREEMIKIFSTIKTVVITSFYESNPNVMVEALYCGCNVITSINTGNSENLRKELLITNPSDIRKWQSSMEVSAKKLFPYLGPTIKCVKDQYISTLNRLGTTQEAVGVYKVNAKWDLFSTVSRHKPDYIWVNSERLENFEEHKGRMTDIFSNIYLHMFKEMCSRLSFRYCHYLFVDESISKSIRTKWENINIWILKTPEEVLYFNQAKFYFVRGNYPNFYEKLIPINAYSVYYPATSFKYNYNIQIKDKIIKRDLIEYFIKRTHPQYDKYNIVLHHEDKNYFKQFTKNKMVYFKKFSLDNTFRYIEKERVIDIIIVGQAQQKSKNHQIVFDFMKYCDRNNIEINIAYVSDKIYLKENYENYFEPEENSCVSVNFYNNISPKKLAELYNQSRINLMLSHRDCVPRVIVESLMCGCYNVATDLLSDGKYYYDGICGELLGFNYGEVNLIGSGMLSYISNDMIFKKIVKLLKERYRHKDIADESIKLYSLEKTIDLIMDNL